VGVGRVQGNRRVARKVEITSVFMCTDQQAVFRFCTPRTTVQQQSKLGISSIDIKMASKDPLVWIDCEVETNGYGH
jgi:hypothetical protein